MGRRTGCLREFWALAVAIIVGVVLVSASGALPPQTADGDEPDATKINVSTRAAVIHYLRSIHVSREACVVIQRGLRNYAGAHCPGKRWTCAGTRHTVVQIAKRGGQNRFACRSAKCAVVQIWGWLTRALKAAPGKSPPGARLAKTGSCAKTTGVRQSWPIIQPTASGTNKAVVWMVTPKLTGLTQSANYTASITQGPTTTAAIHEHNSPACSQFDQLDGSTTKTNRQRRR